MYTQLRWQSVAKGLGTLVPVISGLANSVAGHPVGARYFYSVWLRHISRLAEIRPGFSFDVVAELGPGDALGMGLCALRLGWQITPDCVTVKTWPATITRPVRPTESGLKLSE